ncbi:hypothetical protein [Vibrio phage Va2]|nr:hypothetical protein [Vibrio phage Va2]
MPIVLSYGSVQDKQLKENSAIFLGTSTDSSGKEVHVWYQREGFTPGNVKIKAYDDGKCKHESVETTVEGYPDIVGYGHDLHYSMKDCGVKFNDVLFDMMEKSCKITQGEFDVVKVDYKGDEL